MKTMTADTVRAIQNLRGNNLDALKLWLAESREEQWADAEAAVDPQTSFRRAVASATLKEVIDRIAGAESAAT